MSRKLKGPNTICTVCGWKRHFAADCPSVKQRKNRNQRRSDNICAVCKGKGHFAPEFPTHLNAKRQNLEADRYRPAQARPPPPPPPLPPLPPSFAHKSLTIPSWFPAVETRRGSDNHDGIFGGPRGTKRRSSSLDPSKQASTATGNSHNNSQTNVLGQLDDRPEPPIHPDRLALVSSSEPYTTTPDLPLSHFPGLNAPVQPFRGCAHA
ncbi:hypothetical protein BDW74DRAFT_181420 [Aspergillus multicolor]|uniref:uncharacterized protein n=1 Tax=Aspergillus multicolor TaxID=41759 RepID=UPI003CCCBA83